MGHWARIDDNNIVQEVIVIKEAELDTGAWGDKSKWIKTSYNTHNGKHHVPKEHQDFSEESADQSKALRFRFAGTGYYYDATNDVFYEPKPEGEGSFVLNKTTWEWDRPVAKPNDGLPYKWDEDSYQADNTKGWVSILPEKPHASWKWNNDFYFYEPPIDEPSDSINNSSDGKSGKKYNWDEDLYQSDNTKGWVEVA